MAYEFRERHQKCKNLIEEIRYVNNEWKERGRYLNDESKGLLNGDYGE